ncbi:MAG: hypothetical protein IPF93_15760 [Saprospiraceae bacterium]|nr:hypothetical protein [Saprospiraceae bacterium]
MIAIDGALFKIRNFKSRIKRGGIDPQRQFHQIKHDREQDGFPYLPIQETATGVMRVKDPNETATRKLDLFIFQMSHATDSSGENKIEYKNTTEPNKPCLGT